MDYHILLGMLDAKMQKNHNTKILSFGWVVEIKKWFKRWDVGDILELSSDGMKYVVIEERLIELVRKRWKYAKQTKLEYHIASIIPEC